MSYLIPMGAAIWSASFQETLAYPADHFFLFWKNHCLLQVEGRPEWRTVVNGAQSYVKKIEETVSGSIYLNTPVLGVSRSSTGAKIYLEHDNVDTVDTVVIATHADHAYNLLRDPSDTEKKLLGAWQYSKNKAVLHTDSSIVPAQRRAWASWMVRDFGCSKLEDAVSVTYYMNRLQALESDTDYFVSLNCPVDIQSNSILYECMYQHPIYTKESMATQSKLTTLNTDQTLFCGSYFGYGFHEDAVRSAVTASKSLGVDL